MNNSFQNGDLIRAAELSSKQANPYGIMNGHHCNTEILNLGLSPVPVSDIPDWNARIWRYMDFAKFVSMLQNGALYFPVVATLGDDLEAAVPRLPKDSGPLEQQSAFSSWSLLRSINFASCWHCAEDESAAMWAIYAGRHQGIAIQSTLKALSNAFPVAPEEDMKRMLKLGFVKYIDPDVELPLQRFINVFDAILTKRHWYSYEHEVRLVCSPVDNWEEPSSLNERGGFKRIGVWVQCDLRQLLQTVIVAPKAPPYLEPAVSEVLKRFDFDPVLVKTSRLNETVLAPDPDAFRAALSTILKLNHGQ